MTIPVHTAAAEAAEAGRISPDLVSVSSFEGSDVEILVERLDRHVDVLVLYCHNGRVPGA